MEEIAKNVYKWVLYNINGYTPKEIEEIDIENDQMFLELVAVMEGVRKWDDL